MVFMFDEISDEERIEGVQQRKKRKQIKVAPRMVVKKGDKTVLKIRLLKKRVR